MIDYFKSSIGRKQIVASTGLMLILFLVGHLAGNLFIYAGPEAFNKYAEKLAHLRPGLLVVEFGLLAIFLIHVYVTSTLVLENIRARQQRYAVDSCKGKRSLATKLMPYTGTILLAFIVWHLIDFTFTEKEGLRSVLADGQSYGLYGVVVNSFQNPIHSLLYVLAMGSLGFHLWHGIESFIQTFGWGEGNLAPLVKRISLIVSIVLAGGFAAIPLYILFFKGGL